MGLSVICYVGMNICLEVFGYIVYDEGDIKVEIKEWVDVDKNMNLKNLVVVVSGNE